MRLRGLTAWHLAAVAAVVVLVVTVARWAWVSDDGLITVRHALNLTHGNGFGFNVDERVQGYTHPLWFLLLSAVAFVTGEFVYVVIGLGVVLSAVAFALVLRCASGPGSALVALLSLATIPVVAEYGTAGLEAPLAWTLVALAWGWSVTHRESDEATWAPARPAAFGLVVAGLLLTRLDLALVVAPVVAVAVLRRAPDATGWRALRLRPGWRPFAVAAAAPLVAWHLFSLVTYGLLFPTTAYAKLNVEIPRSDLVVQGLRYVGMFVERQPTGALLLLVATAVGLASRRAAVVAWVAGTWLYLGYVVAIGGDFMEGRFFAVPVLVGALVLASSGAEVLRRASRPVALGVGGVGVVVLGTAVAASPVLHGPDPVPGWSFTEHHGIADEAGQYSGFRLSTHLRDSDPRNRLDELRVAAAAWTTSAEVTSVEVRCGLLGRDGILGGPGVHVIDTCALTDLFLAMQPYEPDGPWKPGHFRRELPAGYEATILTGDNRLQDATDRQLWSDVRLLTRGPLFSGPRWRQILAALPLVGR